MAGKRATRQVRPNMFATMPMVFSAPTRNMLGTTHMVGPIPREMPAGTSGIRVLETFTVNTTQLVQHLRNPRSVWTSVDMIIEATDYSFRMNRVRPGDDLYVKGVADTFAVSWSMVRLPRIGNVCIPVIKAALIYGWFPLHPVTIRSPVRASSSGALTTHSMSATRAVESFGRRAAAYDGVAPPAELPVEEHGKWYLLYHLRHRAATSAGNGAFRQQAIDAGVNVTNPMEVYLYKTHLGGRASRPPGSKSDYRGIRIASAKNTAGSKADKSSSASKKASKADITFYVDGKELFFGTHELRDAEEWAQGCRLLLGVPACPVYMERHGLTPEALLDKLTKPDSRFMSAMNMRAQKAKKKVGKTMRETLLPAVERYVQAAAEAREAAAAAAGVAAEAWPEVEPDVSWEEEVAMQEEGEGSNKRTRRA